MRPRRALTATAAAASLSAAVLSAAPAQAAGSADRTRSLAAVLAADGSGFDGNWDDFDIVDNAAAAVLAARPSSPVAVLADGRVRLTAFLPTDRAFRILAHKLTGKWYQGEAGTFAAVASLGIPTVEAVLLYHVVPGATLDSGDVLDSDGAMLATALGPSVTVDLQNRPKGLAIALLDQDPNATNATVNLDQVDINKGNRQIAHGVDKVLRPVDLQRS